MSFHCPSVLAVVKKLSWTKKIGLEVVRSENVVLSGDTTAGVGHV